MTKNSNCPMKEFSFKRHCQETGNYIDCPVPLGLSAKETAEYVFEHYSNVFTIDSLAFMSSMVLALNEIRKDES